MFKVYSSNTLVCSGYLAEPHKFQLHDAALSDPFIFIQQDGMHDANQINLKIVTDHGNC